jgi:hypothetical protein
MARIQQNLSPNGGTSSSTRLIAYDANLMRQQAPLPASIQGPASGSVGTELLEGDVILQAQMKSCCGGNVVFALEASEALDLAKQLIASASGHLKKTSN